MANNNASKICEVGEDVCKRQVRALCFHCSKNLCRIHLAQHSQLIEENTRIELHSLADKFNELSSKFNDLAISSVFLEHPFAELEKWRLDAHEKIDQMAQDKQQEINDKIDEYKELFAINNDEQLKMINRSKKMIAELIQDTDASSQQIADLQTSINITEKYLNSLNTHKISAITRSPLWFVDIYTQFFCFEPTPTEKLREFKVVYIRLNGIVRQHYVKANKDGTMSNLIQNFIRNYPLLEALARLESNSILMIDHQPRSDLILPVKIYDHNVSAQYVENHQLNMIAGDESVVFYEIPHSLNDQNNPCILMPCNFRRLPDNSLFGWPVYLSVPRKECRGQHVLDALRDLLGKFFPLNPNTDRQLYDAYLRITVNRAAKECKLNDVLQDEIDFSKVNATLLVNIVGHIADEYEQNTLK